MHLYQVDIYNQYLYHSDILVISYISSSMYLLVNK